MPNYMNYPMTCYLKRLVKYFSLAVLLSSITFSAFAINLQDAKQQGLVGEMPSGYLGAVSSKSEVTALVKEVNQKRKTVYIKIAKKNKLSLAKVAILAGKKALSKTENGHYIKNAAGEWVKK
jgi:uncharacterized protein YdbL (DUF1318 family)